jgi:hypothetical protein
MSLVKNFNYIINELIPYTAITLRVEFTLSYWNAILLPIVNKRYFSTPFIYKNSKKLYE